MFRRAGKEPQGEHAKHELMLEGESGLWIIVTLICLVAYLFLR